VRGAGAAVDVIISAPRVAGVRASSARGASSARPHR